MNPLLFLLIIPALTMASVVLTGNVKQVRIIAAVGMTVQLIFSFLLLYWFYQFRREGNNDPMLFVSSTVWYESFNIQLKFGIDGISMSMIILTSIVTFAGVFASWQVEYQIGRAHV